ncbi:Uncharacterised protein [Bordetella pertussis]|nr:Uncharacterised protein [Bordetella pertussis]
MPHGVQAGVRIAAGHEAGVRAAEAERHAEALRRTHGDVGAPLSRRLDQRQRQQVRHAGDHGALRVRGLRQFAVIGHAAQAVRILQQHAEAFGQPARLVADHQFDAQALGARAHHFERLRVAVLRHEEHRTGRTAAAARQRHGLGRGGAFIQQRGVGDVQAGQVGDHGLVIEQRLQAALRDFGLIRRVGGVPGRVLEHIAQHHVGRVRAVVTLADVVAIDLVARGNPLQVLQHIGFAARGGQRQWRAAADAGRHDFVDQGIQAGCADGDQHRGLVLVGGADMAGNEIGMGVRGARHGFLEITGRRGRPAGRPVAACQPATAW